MVDEIEDRLEFIACGIRLDKNHVCHAGMGTRPRHREVRRRDVDARHRALWPHLLADHQRRCAAAAAAMNSRRVMGMMVPRRMLSPRAFEDGKEFG